MDIAEKKRALRREIRQRERALEPAYKAESSANICRRLAALPEFEKARVVLAFVSLAREIDTREFLLETLSRGKTLLLPRCEPERRLALCEVTSLSDDLEPGAMGIWEPKRSCAVWEPERAELAVVPCTSFDRQGRRLGQGGGYYDRLLPRLHCPTVCICRERLLADEVPTEPHDLICSLYLTEKGLLDFS